jgi:hypothetical protein
LKDYYFYFYYAGLKLNRVEHQKFGPRQAQGAQPVVAANPPVGEIMRD